MCLGHDINKDLNNANSGGPSLLPCGLYTDDLGGPCACPVFHIVLPSCLFLFLFLSLLTPPSHQLWLRSVSDGDTGCSDLAVVVVVVVFVALCAPCHPPFSLSRRPKGTAPWVLPCLRAFATSVSIASAIRCGPLCLHLF